MSTEIWTSVIGYEDFYICSTEGRVMSVDRLLNAKSGRKRLYKGQLLRIKLAKSGYSQVGLSKSGKVRWYTLGRLIYQSFKGPTDLHIDHINEIKTDNRLVNLQALSVYDNNIKSKRHNKTSKYPGVYRYVNGKWKAQITVNSKRISLGSYATPELAAQAYADAKARLHTFHPNPVIR